MTNLEKYQVEEIEDTLRLVSNMMEAPNRDTCLKRMVMRCWNYVYDALHDVPQEVTSDNGIHYYLGVGQTPYNDNRKKTKNK